MNLQYYQFLNFPNGGLVCAFSSRHLGNMSFIYGDTKGSLKNRQDFLSALGIDYQDLVCAKQVHKSQIRYVKEDDKGKGALSYDTAFNDTDALITDKKRLPLAIFTADCLPISLYDPKTSAIGLIHAGWRSTQENIARHAVQLIQEKFNSRPEDLYVGFAPAIRQCCYEVKSELNNLFADELIEKDGSYYLDLVGLNKKQLLGSGIKEEHILDCQICTSCQNKNFFSYRREGKNCGRMMSVIMLK